MVRLLLAHGGDAAAVDAAGDTAVHAALRGGHVDAALALLEEGACLEAKGAGGRTPMDVAPPQVREAVQARRGHDKAAAAALRQAEADQLFEEQQAEEAAGVYMHVAQLHAGGVGVAAGSTGGWRGRPIRAARCQPQQHAPFTRVPPTHPHSCRTGQFRPAVSLPAEGSTVLFGAWGGR